ncbi:RNA pseudouridine synthase [Sphingomonas sabuli]|uniref:RNA pseudouridine synthase n=1 Tax=Sphingomonas sabuli TaxID=2764186 RepID=A0A7G9L1U2_9SPHN|nr:RNA pseudouridine synthase [Sphingomonas sabuli]QNM82591.1 RNA pseudouridine synthase [Sphingomonas sabuli]
MSLEDRILFIDGEAIVIDKPAGLPVDAPRRGGESLVGRAGELRCGFRSSPVPMHRLDQDTSGCLLLARNANARRTFQQAFEARGVRKAYLAVIASELSEAGGTIELALAKQSSADAGWRMVADPAGQEAVTNWRRIAVRDGHTLVEFTPVTGRTHQIRAHARAAFGRGIVGDRVYGVPGGSMLLHASRLVVPRPGKPDIDATAPLPDYFGDWRTLDTLGPGDEA